MEISEPQAAGRGARRWSSWLMDERVLQVLAQLLFAGLVLGVGYLLYQNLVAALAKQGLKLGFSFLNQISGFDISLKLLPHTRASSNWRAIQIAVLNTIVASILAILVSTVLGVLVGIMRISRNLLVNRAAWLYIEIFRNIPLLLVIIASYAVYVYNLPDVKDPLLLPGPSFLSNRGLNLPRPVPSPTAAGYLVLLGIFLALAVIVAIWAARRYRLDSFISSLIVLGILLALGLAAWFILPEAPFHLEIPIRRGFNFLGGIAFPPELMGIVIGLVIGSSPFTADTVRAGLQSVPKGQIEAARALGMSGYHVMRLIIFPQAMRVIIPPMTSNYLSLIKNSSLASAIAYPEIVHISSTITSQTGRSVEMMLLMMAIYAAMSLVTSLIMNWYNHRVRIVER